MKKRFIMFMCVMMLLVSSAVVVSAYDKADRVRGRAYNHSKETTFATICCVGTSSKAYTTITNKAVVNLRARAAVQEYIYDIGWQREHWEVDFAEPGMQVVSPRIDRYMNSATRYYKHYAIVYSPINSSCIELEYSYKANQYY